MKQVTQAPAATGRHSAPNPGIVASVFTALFIAGLVPVTLLMGDTHFPAPLAGPG